MTIGARWALPSANSAGTRCENGIMLELILIFPPGCNSIFADGVFLLTVIGPFKLDWIQVEYTVGHTLSVPRRCPFGRRRARVGAPAGRGSVSVGPTVDSMDPSPTRIHSCIHGPKVDVGTNVKKSGCSWWGPV